MIQLGSVNAKTVPQILSYEEWPQTLKPPPRVVPYSVWFTSIKPALGARLG
jgi:hypothetical protein